MPRNLVLFDLEWNIGYQPYTFNYHGVQQTCLLYTSPSPRD